MEHISLTPGLQNPSSEFTTLIAAPSMAQNPQRSQLAQEEDIFGFNLELPPEVASADISIAPDGAFVETSSGAAARELKRRYDQYIGVGKELRSPYAITAFVNQHGKQMYRVGLRELSAPAASAEDAELRTKWSNITVPSSQVSHPYPPQTRRRSRMSVHSFLPSSVFKNGTMLSTNGSHTPDGSRSPPVRKLRKTRSIPNVLGVGVDVSSGSTAPGTNTSRPHAHSVSSADIFRPPSSVTDATNVPYADIFADVMAWSGAPTSRLLQGSTTSVRSLRSMDSRSSTHPNGLPPEIIIQPFGPGVAFDSPSWRPAISKLASPLGLREMQSFESGLTARADTQTQPSQYGSSRLHPSADDEASTPHYSPSNATTSRDDVQDIGLPLEETAMHSPYSTEVFDVLQTSRGLPALDRISATHEETTIKLSLKADESAAPRDDPRFVIWGEVEPDLLDEPENLSRSSITDLSSGNSVVSQKRSLKEKGQAKEKGHCDSVPPPDSPSDCPTKMLVAATIERWIAQLTSELDYDELLVFLLTYRTYISAMDLGHLLICRFHWALGEPTSLREETARRIVRVRTFTAVRHWAVSFFDADFVPNRELRLLFANWLNSLGRDPILQRHTDAMKIVRQLKKVFLECKDQYLRRIFKHPGQKLERSVPQVHAFDMTSDHSSRPPKRSVEASLDDADINLDFDVRVSRGELDMDRHISPSRLSTGPLDLATLRQPLHLAFLQYGKKGSTGTRSSAMASPILLPMPHNTLSRVFVNTIGRLGQWKRVLNSRATGRTALNCLDVSAFDVEANETGDLLLVRGGVEQYLKMVETQMSQATLMEGHPSADVCSLNGGSEAPRKNEPPTDPITPIVSEQKPTTSAEVDPASDTLDASSTRTSTFTILSGESSSDAGPGIRNVNMLSDERLDIVSIDELEFSDLSSNESLDLSVPPGLKRPNRRLPTRRDFEFVRQSMDSVSSLGFRTHESLMSGGSNSSVGGELGATIQQWQMNALVDSLSDEEEDGDVDAALRRLEGQINEEKRRAKESKVDKWVQSIQKRQAASNPSTEHGHDSSSEDDYGEITGRPGIPGDPEELDKDALSHDASSISGNSVVSMILTSIDVHDAGLTDQSEPGAQSGTTALNEEQEKVVGHATHNDIVESGVESSLPGDQPPPSNTPHPLPVMHAPTSNSFVHASSMKPHHSFILGCRTETLMQHFCMIDREIFLSIRFEELMTPLAVGTAQETNILDWAQFLRERARLKTEGHHMGSLAVVRGRFNLIANFIVSEIVLTHPNERIRIFTKFIRLAWKAYELKNFNMLVAVIAGLRSPWATKAMQQAPHRMRHHDERMLKDLTAWTSRAGHFTYIRRTIEALTEAKPIEVNSQDVSVTSVDGQSTRGRAVSESKPPSAPACIPFFGVYLSQLQPYIPLPDLVDPTAPHEPVGINPITNAFEPLAHPEVFSTLTPLPRSIQLEPLINVHKQRLVASVVRSFVASQHLASRVQYPLDKKLFQRCLKLRGLDTETIQRALALYSDSR
ncbi:uncharacterized protein FIBRA_08146 [Fibroporia radiculosa]|uniref:Ras GEF n=1 Tax=Fibroporia radiculosa TaxID=599839 RepID=J4GGM0_9APHY|nr:uncharacterized protein FIBRA_08146 [Fibroporia radiculosa]CCM05908.1 predicted protein [Fibroporia radiculosa]